MRKDNILCFDIETTGLNPLEDEILKLSVLDGYGNKVFDESMKPRHHDEWPDAMEINKITPESVADKLSVDAYLKQLQEIFDRAELIVGYNCDRFDLAFLEQAGLEIDARTFDVMLEFAPIYGEADEEHGGYKWQKLQKCAEYYGYEEKEGWHDSLADAVATLHCFYGVLRDQKWQITENEILEPRTMSVLLVEPQKPPRVVEIENGLKSLQQAVDGHIESSYPFEEPVALICNEEGKNNGLPLNRALYDDDGQIYDIVAGNFLIAGIGRDYFCSLTEKQAQQFMERFRTPERFARMGDQIFVLPMSDQQPSGKTQETQTQTESPKQEKGIKL